MTTTNYFEIPELPGKRMFRCQRHHSSIQVTTCASMWRQANEARVIPERLDSCRNCPLGAQHAGVGEISLSPLRGLNVCARCHTGTTRLIRGHLCPTCYNRELEYAKGANAKGSVPIRHPTLHHIRLRIMSGGQVKCVSRPGGVVDSQELVVAAMRDESKQVSVSFMSMKGKVMGCMQGDLFDA